MSISKGRAGIDTSNKFMLNFFIKVAKVAGVAQLVEHNLAKVGVTGSNPATRSIPFMAAYPSG